MSFAAVQKHVAVLERAELVTQAPQRPRAARARQRRRPCAARTPCSTSSRPCGATASTASATCSPTTPSPTDPSTRSNSMTVTNVTRTPTPCTMTITAEFDAPVERVWQLWADPRQLERWWGPPTYPATVVDHDLAAGGTRPLLHDRSRGRAVTTAAGMWSSSTRRGASRSSTASPTTAATPNDDLPRVDEHRHRSPSTPTAAPQMAIEAAVPVARGDGAARSRWGWRKASSPPSARSTRSSRRGSAPG